MSIGGRGESDLIAVIADEVVEGMVAQTVVEDDRGVEPPKVAPDIVPLEAEPHVAPSQVAHIDGGHAKGKTPSNDVVSGSGAEMHFGGVAELSDLSNIKKANHAFSVNGEPVMEFPVLGGLPLPPVDNVAVTDEQRAIMACIYIDQAIHGRNQDVAFLERSSGGDGGTAKVPRVSWRALRMYRLSHNLRWVLYALMALILVLGLFERPQWCWSLDSCDTKTLVAVPVVINGTVLVNNTETLTVAVPRSIFPLMSPAASVSVELTALLLLLVFDSLLSLLFIHPATWMAPSSFDSIKAAM